MAQERMLATIGHRPGFPSDVDRLPRRSLCFVGIIRTKCHTATGIPTPKPSNVKTALVPNWLSNHKPNRPGRTISIATAIMRETHCAATAYAERSSSGSVTGGVYHRERNHDPKPSTAGGGPHVRPHRRTPDTTASKAAQNVPSSTPHQTPRLANHGAMISRLYPRQKPLSQAGFMSLEAGQCSPTRPRVSTVRPGIGDFFQRGQRRGTNKTPPIHPPETSWPHPPMLRTSINRLSLDSFF